MILNNLDTIPKKDFNILIRMTFTQWLQLHQYSNKEFEIKPYKSPIDYFYQYKKDGYNKYGVII